MDPRDETADRAYLDGLPVGERPRFDPAGIPGWEIFPFEDEGLLPKVLEPPVLPEPPRHGEGGPEACGTCQRPDEHAIWWDDDWLLRHHGEPAAVPVVLLLCPRGHHDLGDLPPSLAAAMGSMLQRVERAVMALPGVGRVHVNKWGDGGAHLHLFLIARPLGMQQLRGSCLVVWDDILPKLDEASWQANLRSVATAMAAEGGVSLLS